VLFLSPLLFLYGFQCHLFHIVVFAVKLLFQAPDAVLRRLVKVSGAGNFDNEIIVGTEQRVIVFRIPQLAIELAVPIKMLYFSYFQVPIIDEYDGSLFEKRIIVAEGQIVAWGCII
jgi:hypothetical protein